LVSYDEAAAEVLVRTSHLLSPSTSSVSLALSFLLRMAEPFGIVAGAIGIASAFTACVDCFEYVQFGRHFGRDYETSQLALNYARLRLTRWGESVNIYDDPQLGRQDATAAEIQLAKDALLQILVLFADTESISSGPPLAQGKAAKEQDEKVKQIKGR
jgi:hypothetical protein